MISIPIVALIPEYLRKEAQCNKCNVSNCNGNLGDCEPVSVFLSKGDVLVEMREVVMMFLVLL